MKLGHYVLGFVISGDHVLLMRKERPEWQAGRLNGVGGSIELTDDNPYVSMDREWYEEVNGLSVQAWTHGITLVCPSGTIWIFHSQPIPGCRLIAAKPAEDEQLEIVNCFALPRARCLANLHWIIPLLMGDVKGPIMITQRSLSMVSPVPGGKYGD